MESIVSHSLACYNKRKNVLSMNLEEQQQHILSGAMYNDLTPELVEAREKNGLSDQPLQCQFWTAC